MGRQIKEVIIMLKKSRSIAVLLVCVVMFGVVQPAFAWGNRTGSQAGDAAAYGACAGVAAGVAAGLLIFCTGGLAAPVVIGAAAVAGAAGAAGGAYYGYNVEEKSLVKDAAVIAGAGVGGVAVGVATPIVAPIVTGALGGATGAEITGGAIATGGAGGAVAEGIKSATMQTAQAVNDNKETIRQSVTNALREAPAELIKGAANGAGKAVGVGAGVMVLSTVIPSEDKQMIRDFLTK